MTILLFYCYVKWAELYVKNVHIFSEKKITKSTQFSESGHQSQLILWVRFLCRKCLTQDDYQSLLIYVELKHALYLYLWIGENNKILFQYESKHTEINGPKASELLFGKQVRSIFQLDLSLLHPRFHFDFGNTALLGLFIAPFYENSWILSTPL